jgi:MFS transporter, DHA1 family, inner membrane transport protein
MATDGCTIPTPPEAAEARPPGRLPRLTGSEWALLLVLATVQFTHVLDFVIMMPLGPKLQGDLDLQISPEDFPDKFSSIVSAYGFSAGIMGLLAARLLDHFDRKKSLLVFFLGFAVGTFLCAVAPNYEVLLLGRAVAGGFAGVMGANVLTIVSDVFPESRRATAMGVVMSSFSVASIVGIYVGLEIAEHFGWRAPFTILALLCLPVLALAWYVLPPLRGHLARRPERGISLREVIFNRYHLRAYALTASLIMGSWMVIPPLAIYLVKNLHWPESDLRWVWLVGGIATLLTMTPTGWLADRRDKLTVFRFIGILSVAPVLLVTNLPETSVPVTLLVTTLFMVCTSTRWVPVMAMITTCAAPHHRGAFMSVNASVQQIVMGLAAKFSGLLLVERMVTGEDGITAERLVGYPLVGLLAAASMILAVFLGGRLRRAPEVSLHAKSAVVAEAAVL